LGFPGLVYGDFRATTHSVPKQGGLPTDYVLQNGDTLILDFSVMLTGYRSDFTNTLAVGNPSREQCDLFQMCTAALRLGEDKLRPGTLCREIYRAVATPFLEISSLELFPHHAGHGLGLGHPEPPIFVPESDDVLCEGDVVTLEPGAYKTGVGGVRIEHNYVITANGFGRLSNHVLGLD
jgi:Xaa-Pro aminopeptidase